MSADPIALYSALAGVTSITTGVQLAITAGAWTYAQAKSSAFDALVDTKAKNDQATACLHAAIAVALVDAGGFLANVGPVYGWWSALNGTDQSLPLVVPFASVAFVAVGAAAFGALTVGQLLRAWAKYRLKPA